MKNKGFTLVELMGVVILLSILSLLVVTAVDASLRTFKSQAYNSQIRAVEISSKAWANDNLWISDYVDGDTITITLGQLKIANYVENDFYNPKTGVLFADDMQINITKQSKIFRYNVLDTTGVNTGTTVGAPIVKMNGKYTVKVPIGGFYTELGIEVKTEEGVAIPTYQTTIRKDGVITGSVNTAVAGNYTIEYSVTDNSIARTIFRTVSVYTPSELELTISGNKTVTHQIGSAYTDLGATAYDPIDGIITSNIIMTTDIDINKVGTYNVNYVITNSSNITKRAIRKVIVKDDVPPVITMYGLTPVSHGVGSPYTDLGAFATDNIDMDLTSVINVTSTVNPSVVGSYTVTYNVADSFGNNAIPVVRTVNVIDLTPPVITITGSNPYTFTAGILGTSYVDPGATALDNGDGNVTSNIVVTNTVNSNAMGSYTVTYNVSDSSGNAATPVVRTVNVSQLQVEYLIVGGGGGGGRTVWYAGGGGGGGAGGLLNGSTTLTRTGYAATVGNGGGAGAEGANGGAGSSSSIFSLTANGGGYGGNGVGGAGGSGGGGGGTGASGSVAGGSGTGGQGNGGGYAIGAEDYAVKGAGGGGGKGSAGVAASAYWAGNGGSGYQWVDGNYYAAGGGGGHWGGVGNRGLGGSSIGGNGGESDGTAPSTSPAANTGSGGGGGCGAAVATAGAAGVVKVRYYGAQKATGGTVTSSGGYTYHTFTAGGTFTVN